MSEIHDFFDAHKDNDAVGLLLSILIDRHCGERSIIQARKAGRQGRGDRRQAAGKAERNRRRPPGCGDVIMYLMTIDGVRTDLSNVRFMDVN